MTWCLGHFFMDGWLWKDSESFKDHLHFGRDFIKPTAENRKFLLEQTANFFTDTGKISKRNLLDMPNTH